MKKFLSFLLKVIICVLALYIGVYIGNAILNASNPWDNAEPVELTDVGSPYKFYYSELSDPEKHAYNEILSNVYDLPESIRIPAIDGEQLNRVFTALLCDNPDLFFVGRKCTLSSKMLVTTCSVEYTLTKEEYAEQKALLEKKCAGMIASLTAPDDEWQTELEIHDYIIENCEYKIVESELVYSSAYGAIVNGEAACEGYSKAAKLLFDMVGIESAVVSGSSSTPETEEGPHMWNAVKINGDFYHLDCTWDDPVNENGVPIKTYSYFNVSDDMIADTHSGFSYDFGCTATEANYYEKTGRYFTSYDRSDEKRLAALLAK
ncbi:MAG: hypothetical protein IJ264_06950, partial [Clostridia bacterium]|nr:hypothetical protein [Clostridia bacterium]